MTKILLVEDDGQIAAYLGELLRAEGFDNRQPCVDVIKALLEYGDVTVNLNCGTHGSYEEACSRLKEEGG